MNKKSTKKERNKKDKNTKIKDILVKNKNKLIYFILGLIDIILIIYVARENVANYAVVNGEEVFVGSTRNLLFGRNYITLVISLFICIYGLVINKVVLKNKIVFKYLMLIFILILIFNMMLFYVFTNKVY